VVEAGHAGNDGFDGRLAEGMKCIEMVIFICSKGSDTIHKDVLPWTRAYAVRVRPQPEYPKRAVLFVSALNRFQFTSHRDRSRACDNTSEDPILQPYPQTIFRDYIPRAYPLQAKTELRCYTATHDIISSVAASADMRLSKNQPGLDDRRISKNRCSRRGSNSRPPAHS
jgi:hypothetical protein